MHSVVTIPSNVSTIPLTAYLIPIFRICNIYDPKISSTPSRTKVRLFYTLLTISCSSNIPEILLKYSELQYWNTTDLNPNFSLLFIFLWHRKDPYHFSLKLRKWVQFGGKWMEQVRIHHFFIRDCKSPHIQQRALKKLNRCFKGIPSSKQFPTS